MIAAFKLRLAQAVWRFLPLPVALEDVEIVGPWPHGHNPITISRAGIKISGVRMTAIKRQHVRECEVWENDVWGDDEEGRG
jgi:hypothetical protein